MNKVQVNLFSAYFYAPYSDLFFLNIKNLTKLVKLLKKGSTMAYLFEEALTSI